MALAIAVAVGLAAAFGFTGQSWRYVLSAGVFRARETVVNPETMRLRREHIKLLFYEDSADATVTVEEGDGIGAPADRGLRINGKPEASTRGDMSTQLLVAHLPMLARPDSTDVFMLGLGSGISAGALTGHPIRQLVVAENCEPVVRASRWFDQWNRGLRTNRLVRILNEDARTVLKLSPRNYDVIISQPSNPWMIGVGSVFSREFYQLTSSRLKPGGLMVQWFHLYENHDGIVNLILRTFLSVYPFIEVWDTGSGDIVLLGAHQPWQASLDVYRKLYERPQPREDLAKVGFPTPEILWARQFASQRTGFAIPGPGPVQSDAFPILEYEAPKAFYIGTTARFLLRFDERTWQADLAPEEKRATLAALDEASVVSAFSQSSINPELMRSLESRLSRRPVSSELKDLPSVFHLPDPVWPAMLSDDADENLRQLVKADAALVAASPKWREAVETIKEILQAQTRPPLNWGSRTPEHFAAAAARACFRHGEFDEARKLVAIGAVSRPDDVEPAYLSRVLERAPSAGSK